MRFNPEKALTSNGKQRLTLLLPLRAIERLSWLLKITDAPNITEVIKTALYTYAVLVEARENGSQIREVRRDGSTVPLELMIDVKPKRSPPSAEVEPGRVRAPSPVPAMG